MASTQVDRNTPVHYSLHQNKQILANGAVVPAGVIVAVNASGEVPNGGSSDAAALVVVGRSEHAASYTAGDRELVTSRGVFGFAATAGLAALGQDMVGRKVYLEDNQTVGLASDTVNAVAVGVLEEIDGDIYYVSVGMGLEHSGSVDGGDVQNVANAQTAGGILVVYTIPIADAVSGDTDVIVDDKIEVLDFNVQARAAGDAGNSYTLKNAGNAISDAIGAALGDRDIARAGEINDANSTINAGGTLRISHVKGGGSSAALATVFAVKRA